MSDPLAIAFILFTWPAMVFESGYIDAAIGVAPERDNAPEVRLKNPIGVYEAGLERGGVSVFYRHTSGITTSEDGYGMNLIGVKIRVK